ncbi:protein-tyrosine sulfotransferase-like [Dorcoceras hygrometricum]|uniref:Protein-tyrosine sulfotransferase-like n=1 Tax=Dorcoceras hygrometricum TaxID=472368 RepID=A0A2Z7C609_9LAMI|nr:protein-tyrosine sulfotransferase-like [Dorcoceras hygrometricum]
MMRRRVEISADGLKDQSQESAGSLHPDARGSDVVEEIFSRKLQCNQQMLFGDSDCKTMSLHKLIRQRFALALKIQQEDFALIFQQSKLQWIQSQRKDFQTQCFGATRRKKINLLLLKKIQAMQLKTRRKQQQHPVESLFESAVAIYSVASYSVQSQEIQAQRIEEVAKRSSHSDVSAAKQLTIYKSWMSNAERNSNGESDKKPAKEKDASTVPFSVLYRGALH